jgi:uncharacterized protein
VSIYQLTVPCFRQMLAALSAMLGKAGAHAKTKGSDPQVFMGARLAPDMFPLSSQVRFACIQAREAVWRLRGVAINDVADIATLDDCQKLIADTIALLGQTTPEQLDPSHDKLIEMKMPNGLIFDMTGFAFVRDWAMPQFYFHLMAAYAILRHNGVDLGKADYVAHMFGYLRPGTAPKG